MSDVNNMSMKDFTNLLKHLERKNRMKTGKPVKLKQSQKDMIKKAKEGIKNG